MKNKNICFTAKLYPSILSVFLLVASSRAIQAREQHPFLDTTAPFVCENLILGAKHGTSYGKGGLFSIFQKFMGLRYSTETIGLEPILEKGAGGMIFMPNHVAPIDPVLMIAAIGAETAARPVMTEDMTRGWIGKGLKYMLAQVNGFVLPSPEVGGKTASALSNGVFDELMNAVAHGDNALIYPSGTIQSSPNERLGNKAAVEMILKKDPNARIILVRQRGLWGSDWSRGGEGSDPLNPLKTGQLIKRGALSALKILAANGFYFMPKRPITLEFFEPGDDFPRSGTRQEINRYLERFYNDPPEKVTFVRRYWWQLGKQNVQVVESEISHSAAGIQGTGQQVDIDLPTFDEKMVDRLIASVKSILNITEADLDTSFEEAGIDSLNKAELLTEISTVFNVNLPDDSQFSTVRDLARLISEETNNMAATETDPASHGEGDRANIANGGIKPSAGWLANPSSQKEITFLAGQTIPEIIVRRALAEGNKVIGEDAVLGPLTYKSLLVKAWAMAPLLKAMPGKQIGVLLPAASGGAVIYLAAHLAGKEPEYTPFTSKPEAVLKALKSLDTLTILTSRKAFEKLSKDYDMSQYMDRFVFLDDMKLKIGLNIPGAIMDTANLPSVIRAYARQTKNTVVLFTSGSTGSPKSVPLSHDNVLANVKDLMSLFKVNESDRILNFLPPFHSFGHLMNVLSLTLGIPSIYHANPKEAQTIANQIAAYGPTIIAAPPSILEEVAAKVDPAKALSVRLILVGADALKKHQIELLKKKFPNADILEGYGATELAPVVAVNPAGAAKFGTVGKVLPSIQYQIVDTETFLPVKRGEKGFLVVRGPSIFSGYSNTDANPFVTLADGLTYYNTGDIFTEDEENYLTIHGREDRVAKRFGDKVPMPAIENVLVEMVEPLRPSNLDGSRFQGPLIAVETAGDNQPLVAFTVLKNLTLQQIQRHMRDHNLTGTQLVEQIRYIEEIPMLGSGKPDYKSMANALKSEAAVLN